MDLQICPFCYNFMYIESLDKIWLDFGKALGLDYDDMIETLGRIPVYKYWCNNCGREKTEKTIPIPKPLDPSDLGNEPWKIGR